MKEKILLVGVPHSGTTIVANYISSMTNGFCFLEPHWEFKRDGSTSFFRDLKLRRIFFLRFQKDARLPMDEAVSRVQRRYDLVGIKETYRGDHYASYDPDLPNETLLADYVHAGYRLIPILRDPLAVWNSWRGHFHPEDEWGFDLDGFIENYERFCRFAGSVGPMIYELFVKDPAHELARSGISSEGFSGKLATREALMGDATAKRSTEVKRIDRPLLYTQEQRAVLEGSPIRRLYDTALERSMMAVEPADEAVTSRSG